MNQILCVGKGVILAIEQGLTRREIEGFGRAWREALPDVPLFIVPEARIIERDLDPKLIFEFTGSVSQQMVAEFQRWWKEASGG